jgi:hypothetical protein
VPLRVRVLDHDYRPYGEVVLTEGRIEAHSEPGPQAKDNARALAWVRGAGQCPRRDDPATAGRIPHPSGADGRPPTGVRAMSPVFIGKLLLGQKVVPDDLSVIFEEEVVHPTTGKVWRQGRLFDVPPGTVRLMSTHRLELKDGRAFDICIDLYIEAN